MFARVLDTPQSPTAEPQSKIPTKLTLFWQNEKNIFLENAETSELFESMKCYFRERKSSDKVDQKK